MNFSLTIAILSCGCALTVPLIMDHNTSQRNTSIEIAAPASECNAYEEESVNNIKLNNSEETSESMKTDAV